jgi:hypothetical protein
MICPTGKSTTQHPSGTVVSNPCFGCHRAATYQATAYKGADTFESCQSKQEKRQIGECKRSPDQSKYF